MRTFYTDLAMEAAENFDASGDIRGVDMETSERKAGEQSVKITKITVKDKEGEENIGKPAGNYVTLESGAMKDNDITAHEDIIKILVDELAALRAFNSAKSALIVGLGNGNVTPDALGPRVVSKILVTRFLAGVLPEGLLPEEMSSVSTISPGVLGTTGIETFDIVKGLLAHVKPDIVVAVDALAARSAARVNSCIQFSDTGLRPGSGMGTGRQALNEETLGIPVIAIGVPTVVDAATLVNDSLNLILSDMIAETNEGSEFYSLLKNLSEGEKYSMIKRILDPYTGGMFVTPKDVDAVINRLSNIMANALNIALHPGISKEDINRYMY